MLHALRDLISSVSLSQCGLWRSPFSHPLEAIRSEPSTGENKILNPLEGIWYLLTAHFDMAGMDNGVCVVP